MWQPLPAKRKTIINEFKNCGFTNFVLIWGNNGIYAVTYGKTLISCLNEMIYN